MEKEKQLKEIIKKAEAGQKLTKKECIIYYMEVFEMDEMSAKQIAYGNFGEKKGKNGTIKLMD